VPGFVMNEKNLPRCPSATELRDFAVGDLVDADVDRIAAHVLDCESCDRALRSLDGLTDGLLRSLNGLRHDEPASDPLARSIAPQASGRLLRSMGSKCAAGWAVC